jgi:heme oxygenase|tara:strand:+ start:928 stop:1125 length:198 start_codon:yes stop_codon:yes gene_type:complete
MNERLIDLYNEYRAKYDDFPIVTYNLTEDQQESLIDVVEIALSENREITKAEIDRFQPDDDGIDF